MRLVKLFFVFIALFCLTVEAKEVQPPSNITTYTENKLAIFVTAAEPQFIIRLNSNPTTGYSWFLREYNSELVSPIKHVMIAANNKLMGAPGFEEWTFKVKPAAFIVPQQSLIRLVYTRPWESQDDSRQIAFKLMTE